MQHPDANALKREYAYAPDRLFPLCHWRALNKKGQPLGKTPSEKDWIKNEYPFADMIAWIEDGKNVGFRLGDGWGVLDYDPRRDPVVMKLKAEGKSPEEAQHEAAGTRSIDCLLRDIGVRLEDCSRGVTGGHGLHVYLKIPRDFRGREQVLPSYPGIEFKHSQRRYVVAMGSIHPGDEKEGIEPGRAYAFSEGSPPLDQTVEIEHGHKLLDIFAHPNPPDHVKQAGEESFGRFSPLQLADVLALAPADKFRSGSELDWTSFMMAAHWMTGGKGREEFVEWCISDPMYADHGDIVRRRWDSLTPKAESIKTGHVFKVLERLEVPKDKWPVESASVMFDGDLVTMEELEQPEVLPALAPQGSTKGLAGCLVGVTKLGVKLRHDNFRGRDFVNGHAVGQHQGNLTDPAVHMVRLGLMQETRIEHPKATVQDAISTLCALHTYDSLADHVTALPEHDGTPRMSELMTRYFGAEDTSYNRGVGRLMLSGMVARAVEPGCKFDYMIVLEGPQGAGKSTALRILAGELEDGHSLFTDDNLLLKKGKERAEALSGKWICEIAELVGLSKRGVEETKALITKQADEYRMAYDRYTSPNQRRAVLVATTNDDQYLRDTTGNRRFLPVKVGEIDLEALRRDRDQLLAEARAWHHARKCQTEDFVDADGNHWGCNPVLPRKLWTVAADQQAMRMQEEPWIDVLASIEGDLENSSDGWIVRVGVNALYDVLEIPPGRRNAGTGKKIADAMRTLGWKYHDTCLTIHGRHQRSYYRPAIVPQDLAGLV